ncbi:MAG: histidine kinase [Rubrivivax sp.]|nr:MAG: histidine kinase [Rubrivivax sp.]
MLAPACHQSFDVLEASQIGEARRAAVRLAEHLGFDEVAAGRVALVATELATNLVRHASHGRLLIAIIEEHGEPMVEIVSLDAGPGMANVATNMVDGYSTGGTSGSGLGAVRRLATEFDIFSLPPSGTVVMARVAAKGSVGPTLDGGRHLRRFVAGAVALPAPGEVVCGDAWGAVQDGGRAGVVIADGLGHGPFAMEASKAAMAVFDTDPLGTPSVVVGRMHPPLRMTRGAAVLMATLDGDSRTISFSGAGNIAGRLISGLADRSIASQHGTVGVQIPRLQDTQCEWPAHAVFVLHSDGLTTRWSLGPALGILQHHPTVIAAWLIKDHCRGRDDATVVVLKWQGAS